MMSVNIAGFYKNPFKVGDKVKVNATALRAFPNAFKNHLSVRYAVVTEIEGTTIFTDVDNSPTYFEHFTLYKEEKDMNNQQKTKRVPFTHELWEKWKDKGGKVIYTPTGMQVMQLAYFPEADHRYRYAYLTTPGTATSMGTCDPLDIEIPVTSKRIPFNPELKDAKVFTTDSNQPVVDWVIFKDGRVACQWPNQYMGYYPTNLLEMEIEE